MDLRYVETFYRAAMLGSIAAAAEELHIVPRAAGKRIRVLEDELGLHLLDRGPTKRLRLTPAGTRFLHEAKRILDLWGEIRNATGKGEAFSRTLRVGANESVLHSHFYGDFSLLTESALPSSPSFPTPLTPLLRYPFTLPTLRPILSRPRPTASANVSFHPR